MHGRYWVVYMGATSMNGKEEIGDTHLIVNIEPLLMASLE